jgi:N-acetylmuramoyl-L-alanine amidase-like protein/fibronectin type III domain protein
MRPISLLAICLLASPIFAQIDLRESLEQVIQELKTPDEFGLAILPNDTKLLDYKIEEEELNVLFQLSLDFLYREMNNEILDEIVEHFATEISSLNFKSIHLKAKSESGNFRELSDFLSENPIAIAPNISNSDPGPATKGIPVIDLYSDVQPKGQLKGKTVWLSAGHGWIYDSRFKAFKTQRHNTHGLVEDFSNIEAVNYHLLKYLYNAGANVWTVRERDMNLNEVIVDNDQGAPAYREYGRWATSSTKGRNNKSYRYAISRKSETSTAVFTPTIPESGMYWVSVYFQNGYNRSVDVRYRILHAGGESHISINQEVHGNTWVYLGQFYFEKGEEGKVIISNESSETSQAIIADAVRFGGGMGSIGDCYHDKKSGEPRYEEGARYYAQYQGYPDCEGDISIRPKYAEWELAKGTNEEKNNALYLSWHSNASGAQGTETYVHRYKRRLGSKDLQQFIHKQLIEDIRKGYDPSWKDRGQKAADFGELRGLQTMPGVLLEIGFHDNRNDANALSDPQFRNLVARATYKGIATYFANRNNTNPVFLPEPPTHLAAKNDGNGKINLQWKAPHFGGILGDRATSYKVYISQHGKAFAAGKIVNSENFTFENLQPGTTYFFKISALNNGGESFPTAVVAARTPLFPNQKPDFLIVDGFDRLDGTMAIIQREKLPQYAPLGNTRRLFIDQMNNYDYAVAHANSMAASGLSFDGATNEAVIDKSVNLNDYAGLNWFLGRESSEDKTLSYIEQQLLREYLDNGGTLMISGSELAFDLVKSDNGKSFYRDYLKADFVADDANYNKISSFVNDNFGGISGQFNSMEYGSYSLKSPDVIKAINGSRPVLRYRNGNIAATAYHGNFAIVNFGFPLESIGDNIVRDKVFKKSIQFLYPESKTEAGIAMIPQRFSNKIDIDLKNATEGEATFNLYDALGKAILQKSWDHNGKENKTFYLTDIPSGDYTYEFEIHGQHQKGKIRKN